MNRPTFNENTEVKVISHDCSAFYHINGKDQEYDMYGWRGKVTKITGLDNNENEIAKPYTPENYPTMWRVNVRFISPIDGMPFDMIFDNWPNQLAIVQKKFIDIENLREHDEVIGQKEDGTDIIRKSNTGTFDVGDIIQIITKIDGANASISWDETTQKLEIFSRTNLLDNSNSLRGFYDYIKTQVEPKTDWSIYSDFVFFGEWCIKHTIKYNNDWYGKWRVYDIWCKSTNTYVSQERVKATCKQLGLEYIEELYYGPFISWEHCRSFMNKSTVYGPDQEGIVIKNQSKFFKPENRFPAYLKIVNESFKETMKIKQPKEIDPEVEAAKKKAIELASSIITEARVKKIILKLIDEGLIPENLTPKDMGLVMKNLPKRIYDDVLKEEIETVKAIGENASKIINTCVAQIARKIVIG